METLETTLQKYVVREEKEGGPKMEGEDTDAGQYEDGGFLHLLFQRSMSQETGQRGMRKGEEEQTLVALSEMPGAVLSTLLVLSYLILTAALPGSSLYPT